jgi:(p)ppGpp synthase/HD superfamily hydrolase
MEANGALVEAAIALSIRAHVGQERKGQPGVPYVVHPLQVGMLLARHGFEPPVVAAGILHDVIEDGDATPEELARELDPRVAALVVEVTEEKGSSWELRKQRTIESIATMSGGARAITAADKVHNLDDLRRLLVARLARNERLDAIWDLFRRGRDPTLDYYRRVLAQLQLHFEHPLTTEMSRLLGVVERLG